MDRPQLIATHEVGTARALGLDAHEHPVVSDMPPERGLIVLSQHLILGGARYIPVNPGAPQSNRMSRLGSGQDALPSDIRAQEDQDSQHTVLF